MDSKQIRFSGYGGQGILLAGTVFGTAAIEKWEHVSGSSTYGGAARGGICRYDIIVSHNLISFPQVLKSDILVAMSQEAYDTFIHNIAPTGIIFYDDQVCAKEIQHIKQVNTNATSTAIKELNNAMVANMIMLGAITRYTGLIDKTSLIKSIEHHTPEKFLEMNIKAMGVGFDYDIIKGKEGM